LITLRRTTSKNPDFVELVGLLDQELAVIDGDEYDFYHQYNGIDAINHVIILYVDNKASACGAMKEMDPKTMEIKRMYVLENDRKKGYATKVLSELENWAKELNYHSCKLETGKRQNAAVQLYTQRNYKLIPNFGPYAGVDNSVCFEKELG
jgi:GNAT superfamily N-acetyltransferase